MASGPASRGEAARSGRGGARAAARGAGRPAALAQRLRAYDWARIAAELDAWGCARLDGLLAPAECDALVALYDDDARFRSRVVMARHGYGSGEYRYFRYPLPPLVARLRAALYARLAPIANRWSEVLGERVRFPAAHADYLARCHAAGQKRPTPLLLRYQAGDYNRLHQDLYGAQVFPLQATVLLSVPGRDFRGGELVFTEQRPRMQSRADVVALGQGDAVVFAVRERPVRGARGLQRAVLRHGVSRLHAGRRHTLGVIFHDAS